MSCDGWGSPVGLGLFIFYTAGAVDLLPVAGVL